MDGYKSKTLATWVALLAGGLGLHRFYLHGLKDIWGWLWPIPTALGAYGVYRVRHFGVDDHAAWVLLPMLGLSLSIAALCALIYGLMPDEKWNARFNPAGPAHESGWSTVFGVVLALLLGAGVLMSTIAYSGEHYFVYQAEQAARQSPAP